MIDRLFSDISEENIDKADQQSFLVSLGWSRGSTWDELLQSKRVLIVSEAGAGKTYECRKQSECLRAGGKPAFFVELAALATEDLRSLLDVDEEALLDDWLASQSDVATFFLDSIDELKLTRGSFERALKRLAKCIGTQLNRAKIVITTRPVPFDEQLIRKLLPVPEIGSSESDEFTFAQIAMGEHQKQRNDKNKELYPEWRSVALMPLSDEQIIQFSQGRGVNDPGQLLNDLKRRNAQEFARRPQDLIELCADWREHKRIRTHHDQVVANVHVKLLPRDDRLEAAELSVDKAIEGAARLALAVLMTRRLTIRHSAASDITAEEAAIDPAIILSDWQPSERKALLERSLFGFASYGRVRFHHRSVAEYLAAERLMLLRRQGMSFRALKRLIFAETKDKIVVRPSKRSVAGWLALQEQRIFELLRDHEPAVLLDEGDPESLTQLQRNQALRAYAERYGSGSWRGLQVPTIQIHRFASEELADEIGEIWRNGVENPEVREVLIKLIEAGRLCSCADIVFNAAIDSKAGEGERISSLYALTALNDKRLHQIAEKIADADEFWPDRMARGAIPILFPGFMSVAQLCRALGWIRNDEEVVLGLCWQLPRIIATAPLDLNAFQELRKGLVQLVSCGLIWQKDSDNLTSDRRYLCRVLAATCERGLTISQDDRWLHASALALRLDRGDHNHDEPISSLRKCLANLDGDDRRRLFWIEDALVWSVHKINDPWKRFAEITIDSGASQLIPARDMKWVTNELGDKSRSVTERAVVLEVAIYLHSDRNTQKAKIENLRPFIADEPSLLQRLDDQLKPSKYDYKHIEWEKKQAERKEKEEQKRAGNRENWIHFWREVADQPEDAFSSEQSWNTALNLWHAMRRDGGSRRLSGWNRSFIQKHFNKETADRLRNTLMKLWRENCPSLSSEMPEYERNSILVRWQFGLSGIYAEAEDPDWATKLNDTEACLAARYALIELNGFPQWMESLVCAHPIVVDLILGSELSWELNQSLRSNGHSHLLQNVIHASDKIAKLLLPRLESWLHEENDLNANPEYEAGVVHRVQQVARAFLNHGGSEELEKLQIVALQKLEKPMKFSLRLVWLTILMRINPHAGVEQLENEIKTIEPSERSEAVTWFSHLFGGHQGDINLNSEGFTPRLLLRLVRLAYVHVRVEDDAYHEGSYSPDTRDEAEYARNHIVLALFNAKGEDALAAKLKMASDSLFAHFKDRIIAVAEENLAQEIDCDVLDEGQAVVLDRSGEAPASTNEAMFAILKDRLSDLDELLLRDDSPRENWAGISQERVMRREIARALSNTSNSLYKVAQESVTADEKETDIRLCSASAKYEAVIELKLGDDRSATDLRDTIESQLVRKYMAAGYRKAGALLVTLSKDRTWRHPDERGMVDADGLLALLNAEASRVEAALGSGIRIHVHLLDLRPRLPTEANSK